MTHSEKYFIQILSPLKDQVDHDLILIHGYINPQQYQNGTNFRFEVTLSGYGGITVDFHKMKWIKTDFGGLYEFKVALNSYLLDSKKYQLYFELKTADGHFLVDSVKQTFSVNNSGKLAQSTQSALRDVNAQLFLIVGEIDSTDFPYANEYLCKPWFDQDNASEYIQAILKKYKLSEQYIPHFQQFVNEGYLTLESFIPADLVNAANREIEALIASGEIQYQNGSGDRLNNLFLKSQAVQQIWSYPEILTILSALFDDDAIPCQTLNFIHGTQQGVHQDVIHLTPFPQNYMFGVWVALEDIHADAGPLFVFPGSHRLPCLYMNTISMPKVSDGNYDRFGNSYLPRLENLLQESQSEKIFYTPKSGSVLVWHANLAHGGSVRNNMSLTRKSMVSHYFARGAIAYYDATGQIGSKKYQAAVNSLSLTK